MLLDLKSRCCLSWRSFRARKAGRQFCTEEFCAKVAARIFVMSSVDVRSRLLCLRCRTEEPPPLEFNFRIMVQILVREVRAMMLAIYCLQHRLRVSLMTLRARALRILKRTWFSAVGHRKKPRCAFFRSLIASLQFVSNQGLTICFGIVEVFGTVSSAIDLKISRSLRTRALHQDLCNPLP